MKPLLNPNNRADITGGIRGAFTASLLATLQENVESPLANYFDLIAGTSTGGIIATALAMDIPTNTIRDFYSEYGSKVFGRPTNIVARLLGPKHNLRLLESALKEVLGERILNEANHRLIVPSIDLIKGQTVTFKTPHLPGMVRDRWFPAFQVSLATAAPTYFQPYSIQEGSLYTDGGLWANNPSIVSYAEAIRINRDCQRDCDPHFTPDDICLLSIGTGSFPYYVNPGTKGAGLIFWSSRFLDVTSGAQSQGADFVAGFFVKKEQYSRINFQLPDSSWGLDASDKLGDLMHRGRERAFETLAQIKTLFLTETAIPYVPFDN